MKVSALICSLWVDDRKPQILNKCIKKLKGADEILSLVTEPNTRLGFADSWNRLAKIATGDYLIFIGDNNFLIKGNLRDMCIPDTITFPIINGIACEIIFCMPRNIYNKIGLYDEIYNNGIHYEDIDFWRNVLDKKINYKFVSSVKFYKPVNGRSILKINKMWELRELNKKIYINKWGSPELNLNMPKEQITSRFYDFMQLKSLLFDFPSYVKGYLFTRKIKDQN